MAGRWQVVEAIGEEGNLLDSAYLVLIGVGDMESKNR